MMCGYPATLSHIKSCMLDKLKALMNHSFYWLVRFAAAVKSIFMMDDDWIAESILLWVSRPLMTHDPDIADWLPLLSLNA